MSERPCKECVRKKIINEKSTLSLSLVRIYDRIAFLFIANENNKEKESFYFSIM